MPVQSKEAIEKQWSTAFDELVCAPERLRDVGQGGNTAPIISVTAEFHNAVARYNMLAAELE